MERKKKVERETKTLFLISPITEINKKYIDPCKDNFLGNFYEKKKKKEKTSWTLEKNSPVSRTKLLLPERRGDDISCISGREYRGIRFILRFPRRITPNRVSPPSKNTFHRGMRR